MIIVSGYRRCGTSMMIRALFHGGLQGSMGLCVNPGFEDLNRPANGYCPNPHGLYEIGQLNYMDALALRQLPDNALVKILFDGLTNVPARERGQHAIIFMHRDPAEIASSLERSDAHLRASGVKENPEKGYVFDCFRPYKPEDIDHVLGIMRMRQDVDLIEVDYRSVIEDPLGVFSKLALRDVPIDPDVSASFIDPSLYRFRSNAA